MRVRSFWGRRELRWRVVNLFQEDPRTTVRDVAGKLGVSETTAKRLIKFCKETFMLPRVPKRQWTAELIQEAVDYNRKEEKRRTEIMQYGECQNCGETGKTALQYRKLTEREYWILYKVCSTCGTMYGFKIEGDSYLDVTEKIGVLGELRIKFEEDIKLARSIVRKLERGETVPREQLDMLIKWAKKWRVRVGCDKQ